MSRAIQCHGPYQCHGNMWYVLAFVGTQAILPSQALPPPMRPCRETQHGAQACSGERGRQGGVLAGGEAEEAEPHDGDRLPCSRYTV